MASNTTSAPARAATPSLQRRAVVAFFIVYLAVQLAIPAVLLRGGDDRGFGWQMYSVPTDYRFEVEFADGSITKIADLNEFVLHSRTEVDYTDALPPFLCTRLSGASRIRTVGILDGSVAVHRCPR
ncbi:MAG TPA: hypothetical protein VHL54_12935 [Actinomycetota bacterium]|nr:hypothetical protein [Actinomycetota bacterium]